MQYSVFWVHLSVPQWDIGENITWPSRWVLQAPSPGGGGALDSCLGGGVRLRVGNPNPV